MTQRSIIERAFELAKSGEVTTVEKLGPVDKFTHPQAD